MSNSIENTLVLCDLDNLLLNAEGSLPQLHRDVLQLFASRGGKLTIYSQRSPKVVRSLLGGVRLSAPALVCGGVLAYNFAEGTGTALCSFAGMEESVLRVLPSVPGVGIALQMKNGSTRVLRMSESLEAHLRQEWTTFVLSNAADVRGEDVLRILLYQDKKQMPILPTLQKALGDAAAFLHAERLAPDTLVVTAWTQGDHIIQGVRVKGKPMYAVQFHPESVMTQDGYRLLANWLKVCGQDNAVAKSAGLQPKVTK